MKSYTGYITSASQIHPCRLISNWQKKENHFCKDYYYYSFIIIF